MNCDICKVELGPDQVKHFEIWGTEYNLCGWDALRVKQYVDGNISHHILNIFWGAGHICWSSWSTIRDILREHNIKEVLEIGTGLSSEMFVSEGMKLISFDVWKEHVELHQQHLGLKAATFHHYEGGKEPPIEELYPDRKWDFVFVDSPQVRANEVRVAMRVSSKFIYLHDPNMGEETFFPNDEWLPTRDIEPRMFYKKGSL